MGREKKDQMRGTSGGATSTMGKKRKSKPKRK